MSAITFRPKGSAKPTFCECGDHAFANLTKGFVALVSPEDAHVFVYHWQAQVLDSGYVLVSRSKSCGKSRKRLVLAREILGLPNGQYADHLNRDPLDNRRENIRPSTPSQNARNRKTDIRSKTGVKGVFPYKDGRFRSAIKAGGKRLDLGIHASIEEAAEAYRKAAMRLHGEFARFG